MGIQNGGFALELKEKCRNHDDRLEDKFYKEKKKKQALIDRVTTVELLIGAHIRHHV